MKVSRLLRHLPLLLMAALFCSLFPTPGFAATRSLTSPSVTGTVYGDNAVTLTTYGGGDLIEVEAAPIDITVDVTGPRKPINYIDQDVTGITDFLALFTTEFSAQVTVPRTAVAVQVDSASRVTQVINPSVNGAPPVWTGPTELPVLPGGYVLLANDDSWANKTFKQYLAKNFKVGDTIKLRRNGTVVPVTDLMTGRGPVPRLALEGSTILTVTEPSVPVKGKVVNYTAGESYELTMNGQPAALAADGSFQTNVPLASGPNYIDVAIKKNGVEEDKQSIVVFYKKPDTAPKEVILWIDQGTNIFRLQTAENVRDMMAQAKDAGVTGVALDVKGVEGFAAYKKNDLTGRPHISEMTAPTRKGASPHIDLLEEFIKAGHEVGIKVHAAFNIFAEGSIVNNEFGLLNRHLDWEERVYRPEDGGKILRLRDSSIARTALLAFVNPANDDVRAFELLNIEEVLKNYDVDGIVLDRARYDNEYADFSDVSRAKFEAFLAAKGKQLRQWPQDVYSFSGSTRVNGPLLNDWWEFRSQTIKTFTDEVRALVDRYKAVKSKPIQASAYVGSWFETYYLNGVNWGSPNFRYDPRLGFPEQSLYTPDYAKTGYTDNLDFLMIGTYQTTIEEIEQHITYGNIVTNGELPMYAGISLANIQSPPLQRTVFQTGLKNSSGLMLFDYSQVNWPIVKASIQDKDYVKDYQLGMSVPANREQFIEGDEYNVSRNENQINVFTPAYGNTTATSTFGVEAIVDGSGKVTTVVNQKPALTWNWNVKDPNNSVIPAGGFVISALDESGVRTKRQLVARTYNAGDDARAAVLSGYSVYNGSSTPAATLDLKGRVEVLGKGTAEVRLNGQPAAVLATGEFKGSVPLALGANPIEISVYVDGWKTNSKTITVTRTQNVLTAIEADASSYRLKAGERRKLALNAVYEDGSRLPIADGASFQSAASNVANVEADGTIVARNVGETTVTAVYQGKSVTVQVKVVQLKSLSTAVELDLKAGDSKQIELLGVYTDGVTERIRNASYTSSKPKTATVDESGTIRALKPGVTWVTAEAQGKSIEIKVKVFNKNSNADISSYEDEDEQ
ncbi:hypothetical protein J31TS4_09550 [Paenibacillus sp. J31TS4]|uniref:family 10 glycosylhydrolase n=1 Tax=Paenibacillus sp. J31TS4 TaxID=2807195 RepID=UPI001B1299D0|nr:family 10 glycosylhydrolase [Paenibacillus sp. J31TS4]GIP37675.1 hypothetical protein J31TS4_09550 [Paenibacillus sp. J31TS4]